MTEQAPEGSKTADGSAETPSTPAERARAEAEARRAEIEERVKALPEEKGGPKGPEPTRYGDWEKGGIATDF